MVKVLLQSILLVTIPSGKTVHSTNNEHIEQKVQYLEWLLFLVSLFDGNLRRLRSNPELNSSSIMIHHSLA